MLWDTVKFSFRMAMVQLAAGVITFISMSMIVSVDIDFRYKLLAGLGFIAFLVLLLWNNAVTRGENDAKAKSKLFYPLKGFLSGLLAMALPLALVIWNFINSYYGWQQDSVDLANLLYLALYVIFLPYTSFLSLFTAVSPFLNVEFCRPAIVYMQNMNAENGVMSYMFFVPIVIFIALTGIFYLVGYHKQLKLVPKHGVSAGKTGNIAKDT